MSHGTVYDLAYKGDFNQVKVLLDQDETIVHKPDPVGIVLLTIDYIGNSN